MDKRVEAADGRMEGGGRGADERTDGVDACQLPGGHRQTEKERRNVPRGKAMRSLIWLEFLSDVVLTKIHSDVFRDTALVRRWPLYIPHCMSLLWILTIPVRRRLKDPVFPGNFQVIPSHGEQLIHAAMFGCYHYFFFFEQEPQKRIYKKRKSPLYFEKLQISLVVDVYCDKIRWAKMHLKITSVKIMIITMTTA